MPLKTNYKLKSRITNHWHLVQPKSKTVRIRANDQGLIISFSNNIMINKFMWDLSDNTATTISKKKVFKMITLVEQLMKQEFVPAQGNTQRGPSLSSM